MARKKTITRDQILDAAYNLVIEDGFSSFTARNIATKMKCSTQPIYLEFKGMDDLKEAVMQKIQKHLKDDVFATHQTGDPLVDLSLSYIRFANEEKALYRAVYMGDHFGVTEMQRFAYQIGLDVMENYGPVQNFNEDQRRNVITGSWIVAQGIASLVSSGFIKVTEDQMVDILEASLKDFIYNGRFNNPKGIEKIQNVKSAI